MHEKPTQVLFPMRVGVSHKGFDFHVGHDYVGTGPVTRITCVLNRMLTPDRNTKCVQCTSKLSFHFQSWRLVRKNNNCSQRRTVNKISVV